MLCLEVQGSISFQFAQAVGLGRKRDVVALAATTSPGGREGSLSRGRSPLDKRARVVPMVAEFLTVLVAAALLALIAAMVRQRDGAAHTSHHRAGSVTDPWIGAVRIVPTRPVAAVGPRAAQVDAAGPHAVQHLRGLEERTLSGLAAQVMPMFLRDTAWRIESLREAVKQRDGLMAHRVAHTLHGSAATVGAANMVMACSEIIREVRLGSFEGCDRRLQELDRDFESIRRAAEQMRPASEYIRPV